MNRGFTLIELMVVLLIIAVMSLMIIPEMKGTYEDALLRSNARELINAFNLAYSRAVSANQLHRFRLDTSTGRYFVEKRASGPEAVNGFAPLRNIPGVEGTIDRRISVDIRKSTPASTDESGQEVPPPENDSSGPDLEEGIAFYPDGTADARELLLRDRAGFRLALQINPVTARVRIVKLERQ